MAELRRTPLNAVHRESGAKMVAFGGWEMPVEYTGLIAEHLAVRKAAGLFDVSHMGEFEVSGPGALAFLQKVTANNAANLEKDWGWLRSQGPVGCELRDRSDDYALLALQGPSAQAILQPLTAIDLAQVAHYHFAEGTVGGHPVTVARTGYTGEDGFEIFVAPDRADGLWRRLIEAGRDRGLVPAGLGARDTLRLEAKMCLYGNDLEDRKSVV